MLAVQAPRRLREWVQGQVIAFMPEGCLHLTSYSYLCIPLPVREAANLYVCLAFAHSPPWQTATQ